MEARSLSNTVHAVDAQRRHGRRVQCDVFDAEYSTRRFSVRRVTGGCIQRETGLDVSQKHADARISQACFTLGASGVLCVALQATLQRCLDRQDRSSGAPSVKRARMRIMLLRMCIEVDVTFRRGAASCRVLLRSLRCKPHGAELSRGDEHDQERS